jgi:hypothetical protein
MNFPEYEPYDPFGGNPELSANLTQTAGVGGGLMDPESDYYKRLSQAMQRQIGGQGAAQQRSAALRGAWSGFGGGASPETMATTADIGQSTLEAQGLAEAGLALEAPKVGAQIMGSTFNPMLAHSGMIEGSRQFGAGQGEGARQFGVGVGLTQQQMAQQRAQREAEMEQDAYFRELGLKYGAI